MPVNQYGEEVDEIDFECEECGSTHGEPPAEEFESIAGYQCAECGWVEM